jgi:hypothetical protein
MTDDLQKPEVSLVKRLRDVDHLCVEDCFLQSPLYAYAADRIEQLERERETLVQAHDAMVETLRESGRKRIVSEALLDKAVVALRDVLRNIDEKGEGVVLIVDLLNAAATLAEIEGGKKDE